MPTARFVVEVSVSDRVGDTNSTSMVAADAAKYLAYADQTDLFGYHASIEDVTCNKRYRNAYGSAFVEFAIPVAHKSDIEMFLSECERLARVETAECVSNPMEA